MKFLLIYYTGTYNTRYLTNKIQTMLIEKGHSVDCVEVNCNTKPISTEGYDRIGFSYPIYGFNSPLPFNLYLKKLKFSKGQKYFIYKNSGETFAMNNTSSRVILRRMKHNGLIFCGEYHFVLPYNIHFRFEEKFVKEILEKDDKLAKIMIYDLENGRVKKIKSNFIYNVASFFVSIQKVGGNVNSFLYKVDNEKCIKCMRCVKDCPENNIVVKNGKIKFKHHCDMCMRCSFYCPTDAIKIGFLENWKVTGDYKLKATEKAMEKDTTPRTPYITEKSEGFYKCFIKIFAEIDEEYDKIFSNSNTNN